MISSQEIRDRWKAGETLEQIATTYEGGEQRKRAVSRQAISKRLLKLGFSPRERRYAEQAAGGSAASAERLDELMRRADERAAAAARLEELAAELGVGVRTAAEHPRAVEVCAPFAPGYLAHVRPSP